ncbi:copper homeostasis protein CutC [Novosphingobium terrae]|uniref:copper homeostasis protein CutC n=1 Tax=Novosphingobium terrae TaxID=2726189 RepID=UPI00197D6AF2|nr:copper homeostasis protein CutC [Novosphingobium terrae]
MDRSQFIIVTDLDGTLLDRDHTVSPYSASVLRAAEAAGHTLVFASGRHACDIKGIVASLGIDAYVVSANGASLHHPLDHPIATATINPAVVARIHALGVPEGVSVGVFTADTWLTRYPEERLMQYHRISGFGYEVADLAQHCDHVSKVEFNGDSAVLAKLAQQIQAEFGDAVSMTYSLPTCLEIIPPGISKGVALTRVMELLGATPEQVIAFGDNLNDIAMLTVAGQPFVMANGHPDVLRQVPGAVQIGFNHQHAVARTIQSIVMPHIREHGPLVELAVDTQAGLAIGQAAAVDRIELCSALDLGGLTPSAGLMYLASGCGVPVRAMIRPRPGDFVWTAGDIRQMERDIAAVAKAGLAGVVVGANRPDGTLDIAALGTLIGQAKAFGLEVALHRCFDLTPDLAEALETAIALGVQTILTSGGQTSALAGAAQIRDLVAQAGDRVEILAGGGVRSDTVAALLAETGVRAIHAACGTGAESHDAKAIALGYVTGRERTTSAAVLAELQLALFNVAVERGSTGGSSTDLNDIA